MNERPVKTETGQPSQEGTIRLRMRRSPIRPRSIIKLLIVCLIVGLILSMFGIEPLEFWELVLSAIVGFYDWLVGIAGSLVAYVIIGACVVIPIYIARRLWRRYR